MKNSSFFTIVCLTFLSILSALSEARSQSIAMSGIVGYESFGNFVTLSAKRVDNFRAEGSISGSLSLQLWAIDQPYYGQGLYGYKMGEANLGTLPGGYYISDISRTVAFDEPPRGYYNMVLVIGEWNGYKYIIFDWYNFPTIQNFGGLPPYTPPSTPPALDLIDEYVGIWEGTQTFQFNGTSYEFTGTSVISRYENRGFYSKAVIRTPGQLLAEGETWQFDNGTMYGIVKSGGAVIGTITGTWYVSGRSIISNVSAVAGNTPYTQYVNNSFTDSETMISTSTTSYGATASGTLKKVSAFSLPISAPNPPNMGGAPVSPASGGQVQSPKKRKKGPAKKSGSKKKPAAKKAKKK
jgi:hypothetical protein